MSKKQVESSPRIRNKKARFKYEILEKLETGMALTGSEVKSLRDGQASIEESFARILGEEVWLFGMHIATYPQAGSRNHEPLRDRKLLLHKKEIRQLRSQTTVKGLTLVPLTVYFSRGLAKCELALVRGKRLYDKRQDIKKREHQRDMQRATRRRR
jgi:SsrA-binding protein